MMKCFDLSYCRLGVRGGSPGWESGVSGLSGLGVVWQVQESLRWL